MSGDPSILISGDNNFTSALKDNIRKIKPHSTVKTADSGAGLLRVLSEAKTGIIISASDLSDMDGIKLYENVKRAGYTLPFILISDKVDEPDILKARDSGKNFFVRKLKPPEMLSSELLEIINNIITANSDKIPACKPEGRTHVYFNKSPEGIFVTDSKGHFIDVNPAACIMTRYSKEDLLKMSIPEIHDKDSVENGMGIFREAHLTGYARGEYPASRKDGSKIFLSLEVVKTGPDEFVGFCRDITKNKNTLEALKESEEIYRSLFEGVPDYILVQSEGKILLVNPAVLKVFDVSKTHIIGSDIMNFVADESKEAVSEMMQKRAKGENVPTYEVVVKTKIGSRVTEVHGSRIKYGKKDASLLVLKDITEEKEAEKELKQSREQYKHLIENINEIVYSLDKQGNITYISPTLETLFGMKTEEVFKKNFRAFVHPDDLKTTEEHFRLHLRGISKPITFRAVDTSGMIHYIRSSAHAIKNDDGEITGITGTLTDFTGETLAKKELLESEQRFRSLFENSPFAYQSLDNEGKFIDINYEWTKITGFSRDEVIGTFFSDYWPEECFRHCEKQFLTFMKKGEVNSEITLKVKDGTIKTVLLSGRIQRDGEGNFVRTHCILTDITQRKRAEEYARLLSRMSDDAPASIIIHDFNGKIIYANEEALRLHGFPRREFMKLNLYEINISESKEKLNERIKKIKDKGELDYDASHFRKDGSVIPLHVNVKIVEWENRKVLLNIATDVTERQKAENLLKEQNLFLQQLIDTIPSPVFYKNKKGVYLGCNSAFEDYIGFSRNNIIGKDVYGLSPDKLAEIYEEHDKMLFENPGVQKYESKIKYADGQIHDVIFYKATYNDIKGRVAGLVGVILDISERKGMEEALKKSEAKFKSYVEHAREGIFVVDLSGNLIDVNPGACKLLDYTREELLKLNVSDLIPAEETEYVMSRFKETENKGHISEEFRIKTKNGEIVPVIISAVFMPDRNILAIHTDISELKRAEDGVKEANRKLNLLSSITRHDILNQLTVVIAYLELIEMDQNIPQDSKTKSYLEKISGASQTIKRQILFTKDYRDMGEQAPKWQNVGIIVDETAKNSVFANINIENNLGELEIYADPLFEKVIYNLFENAVKHGEKITKIKVETLKSQNFTTIICEDDGMGIPDEYKEKIFKRQHYTNTGLGLFLSGEILSITGITIKETGIYGKGARFEINVPEGKFR